MRIAKWYKLHKDGEFYFLYRDRCSFVPNDHATKLSSALRKLSKSSNQGSASVKTEVADEKICMQLVASAASKSEETVEKMVQEEDKQALTDSVITVQHEDNVGPMCDNETGVSLPYDIQIHVQRPSPVHEVSSSHRKLFTIGTGLDSKDVEQVDGLDNMPLKKADETNTDVTGKESTLPEESSVISMNKDEPALSALENIFSAVLTKVQEVDMQRVRPISGPATVTCAERPEFDLVRKSRSVTNSLDEEVEQTDFGIRSRRSVGAISCMTQDTYVRPFANNVGFSTEKDSIRRICSSVSFDRQSLKSRSLSFDIGEAADLPTHSVPVQPAAQKANRSRHTSGLETPMSAFDTSSVTSMGETGTTFIFTLK